MRHPSLRTSPAVALALCAGLGCSSGGSSSRGAPPTLPATPIAFPEAPLGRGLSNPGEVALSADGRWALVLEGGAGRVARVDRGEPQAPLVRIEAPEGGFVAMEALAGGESVLLLSARIPSEVLSRPDVPTVEDGTIHRLDIESLALTTVLEGFSGTGFLSSSAGERVLFRAADGGLRWLDLASGDEDPVPNCGGGFPEALAGDGRVLVSSGESVPSPTIGPIYSFGGCDLETGAVSSFTPAEAEIEPVSVACGGLVLRGARPRYDSGGISLDRGDLFLAYDAVSGALVRRFAVTPDAPLALGGAVGPVTSDEGCTELWFTAPAGLYRHEVASGRTEAVLEGAGLLGAMAVDPSSGLVVVSGRQDAGFGIRRLDLASGVLEAIAPMPEARRPPPVGLAFRDGQLLSLTYEVLPVLLSSFPRPWITRLDRYDLSAGERRESRTATLGVSDIASCSGDTVAVAGGAVRVEIGDTSSLRGGPLLVAHPERFEPFETLELPPRERALGGAVDVELAPGCRVAWLLASDGALLAYDLEDRRWRDVPPVTGEAIAMDPSGALLYIAEGGRIRALEIGSGELRVIATGLPTIRRMAVTPARELLLLGNRELALGMIDLEGGTARRLYEGYGVQGRWYRDAYQP